MRYCFVHSDQVLVNRRLLRMISFLLFIAGAAGTLYLVLRQIYG